MQYNSMMKQIFSGLLGLSFLVFIALYLLFHAPAKQEEAVLAISPTVAINKDPDLHIATGSLTKKTLFVPYWTIGNGNIDRRYDTEVYFGITGDKSGIV